MLGGSGSPAPVPPVVVAPVPPVVVAPSSEKTVMAVGKIDLIQAPAPAAGPPPPALSPSPPLAAPVPPVVSGSNEKTVMAVGSGGAFDPIPTVAAPGAPPPPGGTATVELARPKADGGKAGSDARTAIATGQSTPPLAQGTKPTPKTEVSEVTGLWGPGQGPRPGVTINQYELIRELGAGGMGTVFLARDTKLGRKVAIKILNSNHPELTQRFIVEARATARCSHENIVIIYEVGEYASQPYMVLEFLQGSVLTELVHGGKRLPAGRAVELMVPVCRALAVAHEQGIVHRDLKPDNIFVTETGTVKVLDFGIAKVRDHSEKAPVAAPSAPQGQVRLPTAAELGENTNTNLTRQGVIMGTMKYMSPEQWGIGVEIDHRTDIWAVGVILFRLLAGKHPLAPLQGNQLVVTAMLDKPMPKLKEAVSDVPQGLCDIVDRCLMKHKEERYKDAKELLKALEAYLPGRMASLQLAIDESPYTGLSSFQESDANRFFGRSREIAAAVPKLRDHAMMAVLGPSGVGKSSFVRAGLVPALKASGEQWETLVIRPGRNPMAALAALVAPMLGSTTASVNDELSEQAALAQRLMREPGYVGQALRTRAKRTGTKIMIFIDQFEELYTLVPDPAERMAFTQCLAGAADDAASPVRIAMSMRSDFLDRVGEDPQFLHEVMQSLFFLTPPNRDGLRDALVQPAQMAGYEFESPQMVEEMLTYLESTSGALPLMQFAATKLWDNRDTVRKMLTYAAYQSMGGIAGALASHADSVLAELAPPSQNLTRQLFLRLITPERTRAIVSLAELGELAPGTHDVERLVEHLTAARLLVSQTAADGSTQGSTAEIVHESLIHSWPALRRWLDETQEDSAFLDQLRNASKQWASRGRPSGLLWRGDTADEAIRWAKRHTGTLPETQRAFLAAVITESTRAERRRRAIVVSVVAFLTLLVVASAGAAVKFQGQNKKNHRLMIAAVESDQKSKKAEKEAKDALKAALDADEARKAEEEKKKKAERDVARGQAQLGMTMKELEDANGNLTVALAEATESRDKAKAAQEAAEAARQAAEVEKQKAVAAQAAAEKAKAETQVLLDKEQERAKKLEAQLGGGQIIETLKGTTEGLN
ncbi:MAG TPA: serine/threonine-protein kinase [Kofleriaceae bacterium]|nr:serine/threonine-protein kinase [Kofleriaceae bacterium]